MALRYCWACRRGSGQSWRMGTPTNDEVFDALTAAFRVRSSGAGLVEIRRAGDEAVLMFRWPPGNRLFGVPVSLTRTDRRLDWDRPAHDLEEWLESVDLWLMEDVENYFNYRARRRAVDDYIELGQPNWPMDERFYLQINERLERYRRPPPCPVLRAGAGTTPGAPR